MRSNKRLQWAALGFVLGTAGVAVASRARAKPLEFAPAHATASPREPSEMRRTPAPLVIADPGLVEAVAPDLATPGRAASPPADDPDRGNPYDVLLHGRPLGPTVDMR